MIVTIDTNVLVQAAKNPLGASGYVFNLIEQSKIKLAISLPTLYEYRDVLRRQKLLSKLHIAQARAEKVLKLAADSGEPFYIHYRWRPNLRDEADNMFVELAVHSRSEFLITNNTRDFKIGSELQFDSYQLATPSEFVVFWRTYYE